MEKINWTTTSTGDVKYAYVYNNDTVYDTPFEYTVTNGEYNYVSTYSNEV